MPDRDNKHSNISSNITKHAELTWRMHANQDVKYSVSIVNDLLDPNSSTLARACGKSNNLNDRAKRLVVIDGVVNGLYGDEIRSYFEAWGFDLHWKVIAGNETNKNVESVIDVTKAMADAGILRRGEVVIGIGGGVLLDVVGLACSLYRRGVPYIRIPTTLMGQIDAGIGVKTGINHGAYKNRLGTYFAPSTALIDPIFLRSLDERHIANGVAEIIKMALIKDRILFDLVEASTSRLRPEVFASNDVVIREIMSRAIAGMLAELEPNLWEAELARSVDYGHTFSPSLELLATPTLLHGEAVAVDMALCLALARGRDLLTEDEADRAIALILKVSLPISHPIFEIDLLTKALADTVKHRDGLQRIPLTDGIGAATFINDLGVGELTEALEFIAQWELRSEQKAAE